MMESYGAAAIRHYVDAETLAASDRLDNAGHLIGFAAECAVKCALNEAEPSATSPNIHFPDLANAALKRLISRRGREYPLRNLLESSRSGFFNDWQIAARYKADGHVNAETYKKWKSLAERTLCAANLRR
jgi:hypothetical protein